MVYGLLNLHKPQGWTSHDCIAKVRRLVHQKRVGHGGTLDPAATGVLPVALGQATRLLQYLPQDKAYRGRVRFGLTTSTDDLEGEVLTQQDVMAVTQAVTREAIAAALDQFLGQIEQIPPRYSAIQVDGQRLYDRARKGEDFEVPRRTVTVNTIDIVDWQPGSAEQRPEVELAIACGPGTYIRSIARDLGAALGVGGTLASLVRTKSCGLALADSLTVEELAAQMEAKTFTPLNPAQVLGHLPSIQLTPELVRRWNFGQRLPMPEREPEPTPLRVEDAAGSLLGIGELRTGDGVTILAPKLVLTKS